MLLQRCRRGGNWCDEVSKGQQFDSLLEFFVINRRVQNEKSMHDIVKFGCSIKVCLAEGNELSVHGHSGPSVSCIEH